MNKLLLSILTVVLVVNCEKAPEAPKAVTNESKPAAEAPKPAGTPVPLDLKKSALKWIGTKVTGKHNGTIKISEGNILVNENKVVGGKFTLDMATIEDLDLKGEMKTKLETHLKSEDFFEVAKHPKASFEIASISEPGADGAVTVTGNLDIKGISKPVSFPAKITYAADKKTGSAKANFNINRKLWKIEYPGKPDDLIRDEVNIDLDLAI